MTRKSHFCNSVRQTNCLSIALPQISGLVWVNQKLIFSKTWNSYQPDPKISLTPANMCFSLLTFTFLLKFITHASTLSDKLIYVRHSCYDLQQRIVFLLQRIFVSWWNSANLHVFRWCFIIYFSLSLSLTANLMNHKWNCFLFIVSCTLSCDFIF